MVIPEDLPPDPDAGRRPAPIVARSAVPEPRAVPPSEDDDAPVEALAAVLLADALQAGPGLVRLATGIGWRVSAWAWNSYWTAAGRLVQGALEGESVGHLTADAIETARRQARDLLGLEPQPGERDPRGAVRGGVDTDYLRRRGEALLAASADVHHDEPTHPAYDRILDELAPDEARVLRLLCEDGPQPSVDVRTAGTPIGQIGSSMIAPGLNMIGAHAGVRRTERVPAYLNNLFRLGLVWFSREPVEDLMRYQVLEAQPDVAAALREAGRGRTVRRSIHLTPFGRDFCRVCFDAEPAADPQTP